MTDSEEGAGVDEAGTDDRGGGGRPDPDDGDRPRSHGGAADVAAPEEPAPADESSGPDEQPTPPTGVERRLDPRVRLLWFGQSVLPAVVLAAIAGVAGYALRGWVWPAPVVFTVLFALGTAHAVARFRRWQYEVRDDSLYLERGVFTEVRTVVPYVRLQHVDVSRGPLERALGLASVVVYTAGSRGADVTVPGLTPGDAEALQARLERLAIAAEGDDAV